MVLLPMSACTAATKPASPVVAERSSAGLEQVVVTVHSARGDRRFIAEVARTPQEQAQGLMFREALAADRGMIFPYDPPEMVSFWMKNTLIPLDMVFVGPDGRILNIVTATPMSLEPRYSEGLAAAVLEIAAGRAAELGIAAGDRVEWPR